MRLFLSILPGVFLFTTLCTFVTADSFSITADVAETELLLKDKIDPIEIIEFSSDLENWIPVARNYEKIGRAHVRTPVTEKSRMPSSA